MRDRKNNTNVHEFYKSHGEWNVLPIHNVLDTENKSSRHNGTLHLENPDTALALFVSLTGISTLNILVHLLGLKLLLCLYKDDEKVQTLLLIHLSASEIFGNICWLMIDGLEVVQIFSQHSSTIISATQEYISFVTSTTFLFVYYMLMVYITIDRFLYIWYDIRYSWYCLARQVNIVMIILWLLGGLSCLAITLIAKVGHLQYHLPMIKYVYPALDFSVLFVIIISYGYIFYVYWLKHIEPKVTPKRKTARSVSRSSTVSRTFRVLGTSRFYITFLLILTFVGLVVIPDIIYLFAVIADGFVTAPSATSLVLYHMSFLSDALIYIFLQREVRALLSKTLTLCYYGTDWRRDSIVSHFKRRLSIRIDQLSNVTVRSRSKSHEEEEYATSVPSVPLAPPSSCRFSNNCQNTNVINEQQNAESQC